MQVQMWAVILYLPKYETLTVTFYMALIEII